VALTLLEQIKAEAVRAVADRRRDGDAHPIQRADDDVRGGGGSLAVARGDPESHRSDSVPLASGVIAGEALVAVTIPLLVTAGHMGAP
jgi:hypothetical protein